MRIEVSGFPPLEHGVCHVVAEAGANHNNSVERAILMANKAAEAGAWGIKYQLYKASSLAASASPKYWNDNIGSSTQREAFELSDKLAYSDFIEVFRACHELKIVGFATPFDMAAVDLRESATAPLYKIASGDITYKRLLQYVASTGKPIVLSTGAATVDEIQQAIDWMEIGPSRLVLLGCTLTYPTPDEDGNFARIAGLRSHFPEYLLGYSDHTLGLAGGWMTAAQGGVMLEKHYTLDKGLPDVPDHAMSVDPAELAELVRICKQAAVLLGSETLGCVPSEEPARANARRSLVARHDLLKGDAIEESGLSCKRPGSGISAAEIDTVIGRRLARDISADEIIQWSDLA